MEVGWQKVQRIERTDRGDQGNPDPGTFGGWTAAHPNWTEDFLTVNEYSRPGDPPDGSEKNIFGTLYGESWDQRAQNRSYFEQLERQS